MLLENNNNILCTVSAGYSSVFKALKIKEWHPNHNIIFAMANTSKEHQASLIFMNECDEYFGIGINWIEAIINQQPDNILKKWLKSFQKSSKNYLDNRLTKSKSLLY